MWLPCLSVPQDDSEMDPRLLRELTRDRILRGLDASLVVLHVTTARNMPRQVYLEESIEQVVAITTFHLEKNVYPEFDPVYRAESKGVHCICMYMYVQYVCIKLYTCTCTCVHVHINVYMYYTCVLATDITLVFI